MRVLIVDDEASMRVTLAANLELEGFEVVEAKNGMEALALLEKEPFDLLLSDIRMPGISGVDLFRAAKKLRPSLPVLLMTAFAVEGLIEEAIQEGVYTILPKPFDLEHVVAALTRAQRGPLVMVVDDLPQVVESTIEGLRACGLRACGAHTGEEAMQLVTKGDIDVCVVDLVMPGIDGADLMGQIRAADKTIACIAVSGFDVQELFQRVSAAGAWACLRKPVNIDELLRQIAKARGSRPRGPQASVR
ncbi:MAG: response regulator [Myxococcaceae bacterium]|jgi:DNA-binding NtrC family response regulator|nr:response regulator [Myxococcaceae bacterium]